MPTTASDILAETRRTVAQVAVELPGARGASRASRQRVVRWITRGILLPDGTRAKLAAVRCGGVWITSSERVAAFLNHTSNNVNATEPVTPPAAKRRAGVTAARRLEALGL